MRGTPCFSHTRVDITRLCAGCALVRGALPVHHLLFVVVYAVILAELEKSTTPSWKTLRAPGADEIERFFFKKGLGRCRWSTEEDFFA